MPTRRQVLAVPLALAAAPLVGRAAPPAVKPAFRFSLNTSTVRKAEGQWGKPRPITETIAIAQKAGYAGVEPWVSEVEDYVKGGGTAKELGKRITDAGLAVPNAIGFAEWLVTDPVRRKKGLDQAKRDMELVRDVGSPRIAAPPTGATGGQSRRDDPNATAPVDLPAAAERYRALLDIGLGLGVTPIVEVWGFSKTLSRLGETWHVAAECGRAGGAVLPDVYHLYKGGSDFAGLGLLSPAAIGVFHVNDYPKLDRGKIQDADRVYPGDGVAPLADVLRTLAAIGYTGFVSLELFNRTYWAQDPHEVAKTGLTKLKALAAGL